MGCLVPESTFCPRHHARLPSRTAPFQGDSGSDSSGGRGSLCQERQLASLLLALEGATETSFLLNVCPALGAWDTGRDVTRASGLQTFWAALNLGLQSLQGSRPAMEEWAGWWV